MTHAAFVAAGFWIAVFGVIGLADTGIIDLQTAAEPQLAGTPLSRGEFATCLLRCLFGLAVVAGGRNRSRVLLHLRTAGTG